ncbi:TPA: hypothetical protein QCI27_003564 [Enterobacter roggenkampii]|uniref:hypothetical protein n=1 Tax=Enterobacter cloacae complex TaxID=354276 RepID=UPI0007B39666|nr:hypothetical protein [Enterobacter roggenkampii]KZQ92933.1 hypothetical protein A3465_15560 [Enterobacter roggenkampii]HDR2483411.1 hypothetical protein [Enterobacter roggenkampii]
MSQVNTHVSAGSAGVTPEQLLEVIESVSETNYSRIYLKKSGFETSNSWEITKANILDQLSGKRVAPAKATFASLERITKALMVLGKHHCEIFRLSEKEHKHLLANATNFIFDGKPYAFSFPAFVPQSLLTTAFMPILTAIEKQNSGVVFYFSTPRKITKRIHTQEVVDGVLRAVSYPVEVKEQHIDSVFIPNNCNRAEFRINSKVGRRDITKEMENLQDVFVSILAKNNVKLADANAININSAIENIYDDNTYGRVIDTVFWSEDNGIAIPRECRKEVDVCLRDQPYHLEGAKKEKVKCIAVCVRFEKTVENVNLKVKTDLRLESLAQFNYTVSKRFEIINPRGYAHAISLISDIEKAL